MMEANGWKTITSIDDIQPGDTVFFSLVNITEDGAPTFYDTETSCCKKAVMFGGKLILDGTRIRVDRLSMSTKQGAVFKRAIRRDESMSQFLSYAQLTDEAPSTIPFSVELYSSHTGRVWCKTADRRWFCLSAKNGATMSSTVIRNIKALGHAPESELPMRRLTLDMGKYAIKDEAIDSGMSHEELFDTPESMEDPIQ